MKEELSLTQDIEAILQELLVATRASRTTFRVDLPDRGVSVQLPLAEARAHGVASMLTDGSIDQRAGDPVKWMDENRRVLVQNDILNAEVHPPAALTTVYGAKAQMLGPVVKNDKLIGWVSVHYIDGVREWTPADLAAIESAVARVTKIVEALP